MRIVGLLVDEGPPLAREKLISVQANWTLSSEYDVCERGERECQTWFAPRVDLVAHKIGPVLKQTCSIIVGTSDRQLILCDNLLVPRQPYAESSSQLWERSSARLLTPSIGIMTYSYDNDDCDCDGNHYPPSPLALGRKMRQPIDLLRGLSCRPEQDTRLTPPRLLWLVSAATLTKSLFSASEVSELDADIFPLLPLTEW